MSVPLYRDHNVHPAIAHGLRLREVDVILAREDGAARLAAEQLLERATALDRVLFGHDRDLPVLARRRLRAGRDFAGLIYVKQRRLTVGESITDLEIIAKVYEPDDMRNQIIYLPL